jgi:hypothetical protein
MDPVPSDVGCCWDTYVELVIVVGEMTMSREYVAPCFCSIYEMHDPLYVWISQLPRSG